MTLARKTTHASEALSKLIDLYKNQTNMAGYINAVTTEVQEIENTIDDMTLLLDIENSEGVQLDRIGRIINEDREGNSDDQYKIYLAARILVNKCEGTPEELMNIFTILTGSRIRWEESYTIDPADYATAKMVFLDPFDTLVIDTAKLDKIKLLAKPAGVNLIMEYTVADPFTWDTVDLGWDDGHWGGGT